jgi:hypothetical protein
MTITVVNSLPRRSLLYRTRRTLGSASISLRLHVCRTSQQPAQTNRFGAFLQRRRPWIASSPPPILSKRIVGSHR